MSRKSCLRSGWCIWTLFCWSHCSGQLTLHRQGRTVIACSMIWVHFTSGLQWSGTGALCHLGIASMLPHSPRNLMQWTATGLGLIEGRRHLHNQKEIVVLPLLKKISPIQLFWTTAVLFLTSFLRMVIEKRWEFSHRVSSVTETDYLENRLPGSFSLRLNIWSWDGNDMVCFVGRL